MKRIISFLLIAATFLSPLLAQPVTEQQIDNAETIIFRDDAGRLVEISKGLTKVAPSGAVATMMLSVLAPEYLTNVNSTPSKSQMVYLPSVLETLPATGSLYGSKSTLNAEEIIATGADIIIDLGDYKKGIAEDLDALQAQTGIPCIFLLGDLDHMADTFRRLGTILADKEKRGEELAVFIDKTMSMAKENTSRIQDEERLSVMYTSGKDGLGTNAKGSSQAQVIELIGATNAVEVENVSSKGGGNQISMEQLYYFNPDVILFTEGSIYRSVNEDSTWKPLKAIQNNNYYEIPSEPYNWMGNPPSLNMILGIWWLGNLLYPQYYDYNMEEVVKEIYLLFWDYDLTDTKAASSLIHTAGK